MTHNCDITQINLVNITLSQCLQLELEIRNLVLAHLHLAPKLQQAAVKCLREHRNKLWKLAEWKELDRNYTDRFCLSH
jgi:hypothetical protein